MRIELALASVALLALSGCASTPASKSEEPTDATSTIEETIAAPALPEFDSTCDDTAGDGASGADIARVELSSDGSLVFLTYRLADNVQPQDFDRISFLTTAFSADGEQGYQFGSIFTGGFESSNFVFDFGTATQKNITNGAVFADGKVGMRYPVADLEKLGPDFTWYAVVSVDSEDVDFCGGPMDEAIVVSG